MIPPDDLAMMERIAGGAASRHARLVRDDPAIDRDDLRQSALAGLLRERAMRGPLESALAAAVAEHICYDAARSIRRKRRERARTEPLGRLDPPARDASPTLSLDLARALAAMSPPWASVVGRKLARWSDREIAAADGTTVASVAAIYYRAKDRLRSSLAAYDPRPER